MSYYRATQELNHVEDLGALDQLAKTNFSAKEKQLSMMKNLLEEVSGVIGGYNSSKIDAICNRLQEQGYGCDQLKKACRIIPERCEKFPSFKDLKSIIKEFTEKKKDYERDPQIDKDHERYNQIKKLFLKGSDQEKLTKYVEWWLKKIYGLTKDKIPLNSVLSLYEMPALFDWYDNRGGWNLDRIEQIAIKKNEYILKQWKERKPVEAMWLNKNKVEV